MAPLAPPGPNAATWARKRGPVANPRPSPREGHQVAPETETARLERCPDLIHEVVEGACSSSRAVGDGGGVTFSSS